MKIIEIRVSDKEAREWKYFLKERYESKAGLATLARVAILREAGASANDLVKKG